MLSNRKGRVNKCPLFAEPFQAYIDNESLILFDRKSGYVFGLEKESAALFLRLDELLKTYPEDEVLKYFPDIPAGYLKEMIDLRMGRKAGKESYEPPLEIGPFRPDGTKRVHYSSGRITFAIAYPNSELFEYINPLFAHLAGQDAGGRKVNVDFSLTEEKWQIFFNETPVAAPADLKSLPLVLQENMIILHYQCEPYLMAMHAGAIGKGAKAVVFPGCSGSGKSTLAAAMAAEGYDLYSDEIALVDEDGKIVSLPFCLNIKEGSWRVLQERFPDLPGALSYLRFDSQRVKLLPPPHLAKKRAAITALLFLEFDKKYTKPSLEPLSSCETLSRIKEAGYQLDRPLTQQRFEKILSAVLQPEAYLLRYGSIEDGIKEAGALLDG
ncbi:hypothetical protein [Hydrogenimonas sp.]